jgi:hypothetical protein
MHGPVRKGVKGVSELEKYEEHHRMEKEIEQLLKPKKRIVKIKHRGPTKKVVRSKELVSKAKNIKKR